ncbi:hypothetical protein ACFVTM_17105 [Arthrobacter sp. NPDC058130]|uniref:hypothetical protein n=1 Tax=Arthrobacter sp. NPDC058130 TaxID=3346353 RepID=UPI0036E424AE
MLDDQTNWKVLNSIEIHTEIMNEVRYVAYSNNPGFWQDDWELARQEHREKLAVNRATLAARRDAKGNDS